MRGHEVPTCPFGVRKERPAIRAVAGRNSAYAGVVARAVRKQVAVGIIDERLAGQVGEVVQIVVARDFRSRRRARGWPRDRGARHEILGRRRQRVLREIVIVDRSEPPIAGVAEAAQVTGPLPSIAMNGKCLMPCRSHRLFDASGPDPQPVELKTSRCISLCASSWLIFSYLILKWRPPPPVPAISSANKMTIATFVPSPSARSPRKRVLPTFKRL